VRASGFGASLRLFGRVFRNGDLRRLELGWAASNLASRASAIAVAVYAFETSGTGAVGVVLFARLATAAALAPWLTLLADRKPRRAVLVAADLFRCALLGIMAALAFADVASIAVYVLSVLVAVAEPVFRSALAALTPSLVRSPEELTAANVAASAVESAGLFVGPAVGALLLAASSTGAVFAVAAGLLLVTVVLVAGIGTPGEPAPEAPAPRLRTLLAGWATIVSQPGLRVVIFLYSAQTLVAGMLSVLVVVLAIQVLDLGTAGVGWLAGMLGLGAIVAVLAAAGIAGRRRLAGYFAIGLLLWGIPLLLVSAWPSTAPVVVLLLLVGVGNTLVDVTGVTLMQRSAPDAVLGRVFGAFEALVFLTMAFGALLAPVLVSTLGVRGAFLAAGLVLPVLLVLLWRRLTSIDERAEVPREQVELLRRIGIFAPLPIRYVERLALALTTDTIAAGATVFHEGERGDHFYVVVDGEAAVEIGDRRVQVLGEGDVFGEIALLRDVPRTATVRAVTALRVAMLERDVFVATVTGHPASAEAAGSIVAARLPSPVGA
jgi:MFS family permease